MSRETEARTTGESAGAADAAAAETAPSPPDAAGAAVAGAELERELGIDEFDPVGTLVLVAIYLAIVALLWIFVYFVEFLGNDLTVVGSIAAPIAGGVVG